VPSSWPIEKIARQTLIFASRDRVLGPSIACFLLPTELISEFVPKGPLVTKEVLHAPSLYFMG
jgi:hypothetical protein